MMFKQRGKQTKKATSQLDGKSSTAKGNRTEGGGLKTTLTQTMQVPQASSTANDDGEQEQKPDIHQSLGSKKMQEDFDLKVSELF